MSKTIDFYYDYSSPYGYLASMYIEQLASDIGRTVNWYPVLLGPMFKITGSRPPANTALKGKYSVHDFARSAELFDVPYQHPAEFPIATVAAARATIFLRHKHPELVGEFTKQTYAQFFAHGKDIRDVAVLAALAKDLGADPEEMQQALADQKIKDELKQDIDQAIDRGVFGSPFMLIDNEAFWGFDRFEHIRRWVKKQNK